MIFNKSFLKKKRVKLDDPKSEEGEYWWTNIVVEARAVSLWSCVVMAVRILLGLLRELAVHRDSTSSDHQRSALDQELIMTASVVAGWIFSWMPSKIMTQQAPGFVFANPLVLLWVQDKTGILPNLPSRACEYVLGRVLFIDFVAMIPVHFGVSLSTAVFLQRVLPDAIVFFALDPIQYSDGPWIVDFCREVFITAVFTIAIQVLPVIFQLNSLRRWSLIFLFFPIVNFGVDSLGTASALCPNFLLSLGITAHKNSLSLSSGMIQRLIGSLLGGMVGGKCMQIYFPDQIRPNEHR